MPDVIYGMIYTDLSTADPGNFASKIELLCSDGSVLNVVVTEERPGQARFMGTHPKA